MIKDIRKCFLNLYIKEIKKEYYQNNVNFLILQQCQRNISNSSIYFEKINEEYRKAQHYVMLNEHEILKIRNILIKIINEKELVRNVIHRYNIPIFFLQDKDVKNHFLDTIKNDKNNLTKLRELITKEIDTNCCSNGCIGDTGNVKVNEENGQLVSNNAHVNLSLNQKIEEQQISGFAQINDKCYLNSYETLLNIFQNFIKRNYHKQWIFYEHIKKLCDFTEINEIRKKKNNLNRKLYLYVGPTNSGKTHEAFNKFIDSKNGLYCSPLRLLTWEIHKKLLNLKKNTNLLTGQEIIKKANNTHTVCTIEMTPLNEKYDCAIIDEIQMINNSIRGYAWTNVLMNLKCEEIYLCGSEHIVNLIKELSDILHDQVIIKRFKRLNKLKLEENVQPLGDVKTGDCIISFSRNNIMLLKKKLEKLNKRVFVIYGTLPPESKKKQIELFNYYCKQIKNDCDNIKLERNNDEQNIKNEIHRAENSNHENHKKETVLVATDVIGMGLNIKIRRIIFYSLKKYDGDIIRYLNVSEILQIAGRAGRFDENDSGNSSDGFVTCVNFEDIKILKNIFENKNVKKLIGNNDENYYELHNTNEDSDSNNLIDQHLGNIPCDQLLGNINSNTINENIENNVLNNMDKYGDDINNRENSDSQNNIDNKKKNISTTLRAGYFPNFDTIENLSKILEFEYKAKIELYEILQILIDYLKLNDSYFFLTKNYNQIIFIAKFLKNINIDKNILFIYAISPVNINNVIMINILRTFIMSHSILGYVDFFECINNDMFLMLKYMDSNQNNKNCNLPNYVKTDYKNNYYFNKDDKHSCGKEKINCNNNFIYSASYNSPNIMSPDLKDAQNDNFQINNNLFPFFSKLTNPMFMDLHNNAHAELKHQACEKNDTQNNVGFDEYIKILEFYYEIIDLYCWLYTKFPSIYKNIKMVNDIKKKFSNQIVNLLAKPLNKEEGC
ncbi:ATP-dependent DEAD box helicase, putative [Plasmodium berghei]|uniref:ATP-dependent RNA helicase SUV3, putative n=2 Tax=Plasmodium berghei TaxID=5821 RepID=A0A509AKQ3_PLABA|nr:ATP-dependent RNA helicase SUV3, putative [Plasmodium berghei ANKA]CXI64387.1 ATP-dependent DEAD box helicase, putative [Plasmodium berghei]SCM23874.1 ATP-dependent DEAD box helicase, putative [Plasmodium berghei]SCN26816.1 ATP-dependent DEAD box helicase, putative [Plasmodium berghei]SCO61179.1 ATP-dependent DEAD box helicase, putative [Plasmodium berghei]SCO63236.1 ATP-dependent DEAD box helicase, putative [Plasmodium berghei]|eukprot:XP_034422433.1 ATP-dependent RNA helicase SUV3, putative [Plasmodium berghei ANKA]